ncbi:MAG: FAD-dependent oxidoreductase, partial [Bryobacteraceae bacterium]
NVRILRGTRIVAQTEPGALAAETWESCFAIKYEKLVLATGARERFLPFPGWTLPGVMGAGGLQALVKSGMRVRGARVVVAGSGPLLLAVAAYLRGHGAKIALIAEQAPWPRVKSFAWKLLGHPAKAIQAAKLRASLAGVAYQAGWWPVAAGGGEKLEWVELSDGARRRKIACDYLACGFHLVPNTELAELLGCRLRGPGVWADEWQESSEKGIFCAGELLGIGGVEAALIEGEIAGYAAAGNLDRARALFPARAAAREFAELLEQTFALRDELKQLAAPETLVCRCEDVAFARLADFGGWREAKLQTRCGMGPCQGRVCGPAVEFLFGWKADSVRPPVFPARLESLMVRAGKPRGGGE